MVRVPILVVRRCMLVWELTNAAPPVRVFCYSCFISEKIDCFRLRRLKMKLIALIFPEIEMKQKYVFQLHVESTMKHVVCHDPICA